MKRIGVFFACIIAWFGIASASTVSPIDVDGATTISVEEAAELFDEGVVFVDVRKSTDFEAGRVPGAVHLDIKINFTAEALQAEVDKGDKVVIYCNGQSCMRSSDASAMAVGWGFTSVYYFRDGYPAWEASGLPVE